MGRLMCKILLAVAIGWSAQLIAATLDFSCVETYREWNESYFAKPSMQPEGSSAREREDAHRIWGIYHDIEMRRYGPYATEDVRGMLNSLGTKPESELAVLREFVELVESGAACEDGKPTTWVEIMDLLRARSY
jgi:hypothetical protein